jgi:5,10-methylenetetrahydromethanopterin reductase
VNPFTCHPVNIAGHAALIDEAANGRAYLGIARGAWHAFLGAEPRRPVTALREAFECVRHLLRRSTDAYRGEVFTLAGGDSLRWTIARPELPFLLGTWGLATIRACVRHVTEIKVGGTANPDVVPRYLDAIGSHEVGLVTGCVSVVDKDGRAARDLARRKAALYLPVIAALDPTLGVEPDRLARLRAAAEAYDFAAAARDIPDALLRRVAMAGTPDEVAEQAHALYAAGVSRVEFGTPHGLDAREGLRLLGDAVLPALRRTWDVARG